MHYHLIISNPIPDNSYKNAIVVYNGKDNKKEEYYEPFVPCIMEILDSVWNNVSHDFGDWSFFVYIIDEPDSKKYRMDYSQHDCLYEVKKMK